MQSGGYSVARSQSAAGVARPQRARSKSPRRSLSPPADRDPWRYTGAALAPARPHQPIGSRWNPPARCDWLFWKSTYSGNQPRTEHYLRETHVLSLRPLITTLLQFTVLTSSLYYTLSFFFTHLPLTLSLYLDKCTLSLGREVCCFHVASFFSWKPPTYSEHYFISWILTIAWYLT